MTGPPIKQAMTRVSRYMDARRSDIYKAFLEQEIVASWLASGTMRCVVHEFEPREGGRFRMSLIYQDPTDGPGGKTTEDTDTFHGRFVQLVPDELWCRSSSSSRICPKCPARCGSHGI